MQPITLKGTFFDKLSDEEFFQFCQENCDLRIERNRDLSITIMSPTGSLSGFYNAEILAQLVIWNRISQTGLVFDSSTGFLLPDQSVKSPDAAWVSREKWEVLTLGQRLRFAPICLEFVIELRSATDSLEQLQGKMLMWLANGCAMGWWI